MILSNDRNQLRQCYLDAWQKYQKKQPMETLEQQLCAVIIEHPEYHRFLEQGKQSLKAEFFPEAGKSNPFLHMSLHQSIQEQIRINQPIGITKLYRQSVKKMGSHKTEHEMMECLAEMIWQTMRDPQQDDQTNYLRCIKQRLNTSID